MKRLALTLAGVAAVLTGCSSLTVEVDVANPSAIAAFEAERLLSEGVPVVIAEPEAAIGDRIDSMKEARLQQYFDAHSAEFDNISGKDRQEIINDLEKRFEDTLGGFYKYHARVVESLGRSIRDANGDHEKCIAEEKLKTPRKQPPFIACDLQRAKLVSLLRQREQLLGEVSRGPDFVVVEPGGPVKSLVGQDGLFREREAFSIANAPDHLWKNDFDRSYSWSLFGDTNVAIKMESRGNFTIKGVSFDPSEVTRVASKIATQSLLAWTQIAGVPSLSSARTPGSVPTMIAEDERQVTTFEAERNDQRRALLSVVQAVAGASSRFGETDQPDTVKSLAAIWAANRDRIIHPEGTAVPSRLTLAPPEVTVPPAGKFLLFPALASASERSSANVTLTSADDVFEGFPMFAVIPRTETATQQEVVVKPSAAWKTYTITASLEKERDDFMKVHVMPTLILDPIPAKIVAGSTRDVTITLPTAKPEGSADEKVEREGDVTVANVAVSGQSLTFKLGGVKEGAGAVTIAFGEARPLRKNVSVVAAVVTADPVTLTTGNAGTLQVKADFRDAVGAVSATVTADAGLALTRDDVPLVAPLTWETTGEISLGARAAEPGTYNVTITPVTGQASTVKVTVVLPVVTADPASVSTRVGEEPRTVQLRSAQLQSPGTAAVTIEPAGIATVPATIEIPANGEMAELTITPVVPGNATVTVRRDGVVQDLTIAVVVQEAPPPVDPPE